MKADPAILQLTYSSVIETFSLVANIPIREALDLFYRSEIYQEMREGIADMHCRSENYLAEELMQEFNKNS